MGLRIPHIHNGRGAVRPYVYGRLDLPDFVRNVFGAVEIERNTMPSGFHIQTQIGDSVLVLSAMEPPYEKATKASVYVYVEDVDATYARALEAGATSLAAPTERPWQGRTASFRDAFGNIWYVETYHGPD